MWSSFLYVSLAAHCLCLREFRLRNVTVHVNIIVYTIFSGIYVKYILC